MNAGARESDDSWLAWVKAEADQACRAAFRHLFHHEPGNPDNDMYESIRERFVDPAWLEDLQAFRDTGWNVQNPAHARQPIRDLLARRYVQLFDDYVQLTHDLL